MGANTKREGRSGGGGLKAGSVAVGSDSAAKRGVKHHHRPAPRLRFVPPKEEPAPNEGGPLLDLSLIDKSICRAFSLRGGAGSLFTVVRGKSILGSSLALGEVVTPKPVLRQLLYQVWRQAGPFAYPRVVRRHTKTRRCELATRPSHADAQRAQL